MTNPPEEKHCPSDAQIKHGVLGYLANRYLSYHTEPAAQFVNTRRCSRSDLTVFLKGAHIDRYDVDRTRWDRERLRVPNPFRCTDKAEAERILNEMEAEGLIIYRSHNHHAAYFITQKGARQIGDAFLANAFDSQIKCQTARGAILSGEEWAQVPKILDTLPDQPVGFANVRSTEAAKLPENKAFTYDRDLQAGAGQEPSGR